MPGLCQPNMDVDTVSDGELPAKPPPAGLRNMGNTCYLNSAMQLLAASSGLQCFLRANIGAIPFYLSVLDDPLEEFLRALFRTLFLVRLGMDGLPNRGFASRVQAAIPGWKPYRMQDSMELIHKVFDIIDNSLRLDVDFFAHVRLPSNTTLPKPSFNILSPIFGGHFHSVVKCIECGNVTNGIESFLELSLPILFQNRWLRGRRAVSLNSCLQHFFSEVDVSHICPHCGNEEATQKIAITDLVKRPCTILIQLKRFTTLGYKVTDHVQFGETIDLAPFMASPPFGYEREGALVAHLRGVVEHRGPTIDSGHYLAYVIGEDGLWYLCNDSAVSNVPFRTVRNSQALLLLYEVYRQPSKSVAYHTLFPPTHHPRFLRGDCCSVHAWSGLYVLSAVLGNTLPLSRPSDGLCCSHNIYSRLASVISFVLVSDDDDEDCSTKGAVRYPPQPCSKCEETVQGWEYSFLRQFQGLETKVSCHYIIPRDWYDAWIAYARDGHCIIPGKLLTKVFFDESGMLIGGFERNHHYVVINRRMWLAFLALYSGGPAIVRQRPSIYSRPIADTRLEVTALSPDID